MAWPPPGALWVLGCAWPQRGECMYILFVDSVAPESPPRQCLPLVHPLSCTEPPPPKPPGNQVWGFLLSPGSSYPFFPYNLFINYPCPEFMAKT